jgi:GNAT superfamily N-acetyltransferase
MQKYDLVFSFSPIRDPPQKAGQRKKEDYPRRKEMKHYCDGVYKTFGYRPFDVLPMFKEKIADSTSAQAEYIKDVINGGFEITTFATSGTPIRWDDYYMQVAMSLARGRKGQSVFHYEELIRTRREEERDYGVPKEERTILLFRPEGTLCGGITFYNAVIPGFDEGLKIAALGDLFIHPTLRNNGYAEKLITLARDMIISLGYNIVVGTTPLPEIFRKYMANVEEMPGVFLPQDSSDPVRSKEVVMAEVLHRFSGHCTVQDYIDRYAGKVNIPCKW